MSDRPPEQIDEKPVISLANMLEIVREFCVREYPESRYAMVLIHIGKDVPDVVLPIKTSSF